MVQSMYKHLVNQALPLNKSPKFKLTLKILNLHLVLLKGVITTKDNFLKLNWNEDGNCCICNNRETIQYLFSIVMLQDLFWRVVFGFKTPNNMVDFLWKFDFNKKTPK